MLESFKQEGIDILDIKIDKGTLAIQVDTYEDFLNYPKVHVAIARQLIQVTLTLLTALILKVQILRQYLKYVQDGL